MLGKSLLSSLEPAPRHQDNSKQQQTTYVVESIISWIDCTVKLLHTTADMWGYETVLYAFFSDPRKKQSHRSKVNVVKGSYLHATEIEDMEVQAMGKHQVLPKIRQIH
jgi:hypothetical protein